MSYVSNVILSFSIGEGDSERDHADVIERVNEYFARESKNGFRIPEHNDWYGGSKTLERPTFIGAFNYIGLDDFLDHLRTLPWKEPESVQVIICDQHDDEYRIIYPCAPSKSAPADR
jgi:hypothetical protein